METSSPPPPAIDLPGQLYFQLVHTLTDLLPPPLDDTPAALRARNDAAIAKVAALLPVNANEADLAAQCIAARAQAEAMLRLLRQNADDIRLIIGLNAQYGSMVRTSLSVHGRLMRVQALRHKREAIDHAATQDAWTRHVAERSMLVVVNPNAGRPAPTWPETTPPAPKQIEALPPCANQTTAEDISTHETNSHNTAFETQLSKQPSNQDPKGSDAKPRQAKQATPNKTVLANRRHTINNPASEYNMNTRDAAFATWLTSQSWYKWSRQSNEPSLRQVVRAAIARSHLATSPVNPGP